MFSPFNLPSPLVRKIKHASYYLRGILRYYFIPDVLARLRREQIIGSYYENPDPEIEERVNYYNQIEDPFEPGQDAISVGEFHRDSSTAYSFDLHQVIRYFPENCRFDYEFGDINDVPPNPTFLKSRPIDGDNKNSVLLKLNKKRHFHLIEDGLQFEEKRDRAVWRGRAHWDERRRFLEKFHDHPRVNAGDVREESRGKPIHKDYMTIDDQLEYKFIISIEGSDVASNLKWIMNSNSLCLMTQPQYETWFMEGQLEAGKHYVQLRDDYADLEEKLNYYDRHPEEAKAIVRNANEYVDRFKEPSLERLVSLLVAEKYFEKSGQTT